MAKQKKDENMNEGVKEKAVVEMKTSPEVKPSNGTKSQDDPKPQDAPKTQELVFTFDRYFSSLNKPLHHKSGMKAFLKGRVANSKKTVAEWNRLFERY